jgi:hypothetical protein
MSVEPSLSWAGEGVAEEERTLTIQLTNHGDQPVQVIGGTANCACITTTDLPISIPPRESRPIDVKVTFKGGVGRFQRNFVLYTDDKNQPVIKARFAGRVVEASGP